jgi:SAM-dependent methyltransferase
MTDDPSAPAEVPSPIDFHDPEQARAWVERTIAIRPARPRFFAAFASALAAEGRGPLAVAELGSGPGHLAAALIRGSSITRYAAIDFSPAMHRLAREHLGPDADRVAFLGRDFRRGDWGEGLGRIDAVVSMQAAHEVRHKSRLAALFAGVRATLRPGGLFLYCDHYSEAGSAKDPALYLDREAQPRALEAAGFDAVATLHDEGGMALISGRAPPAI